MSCYTLCVVSFWAERHKEDSIFKRISLRRIIILLKGKIDRIERGLRGAFAGLKNGLQGLEIKSKAKKMVSYFFDFWQEFYINARGIFRKPVQYVSHFGILLVIAIVLASGIPMPKSADGTESVLVDPFGMARSVQADKEGKIDITELEAVAMTVSFIDTELANRVYEKIGEKDTDSQIVLAGETLANVSVIKTESSSKIDKKYERYIVQGGDTLSGIATRFGVSTNSIVWSNSIGNVDSIKPGTTLLIPAVTGILHRVSSGDSVEALASRYRSQASLIVAYNDLYGESLTPGETIIIPNGIREAPKPPPATVAPSAPSRVASGRFGSPAAIASSGVFRFPTVVGRSGFFNGWHWWAIDIPNSIGTPIFASDSGRIIEARYGWNGGYGNTILIDHGNGYHTRYAHLSTLVMLGGYVSKGQLIGHMGSTGRSTGSHLHFEIIRHGAKQNPMKYF